jgi:hypothetical protein|nr:MAG TPA: Major tail protein [Caudoviricetes sp.]
MAISTYKTFLMKKGSGSTYEKLVDIKNFPDLGGEPDKIETTTLSDGARTYIPGIEDTDNLSFDANYTKTDFTTLKALKGTEQDLAIWFGGTESEGTVTPTGSDGKFEFKGYVDCYVKGGDVNSAVEMSVVVTPSTAIAVATA